MQVRKFILSAVAGAAAALIGGAALADASVISGSSATSYVGTGGGSSLSMAVNRQTATLQPGVTVGGATTLLGQSIGAASTDGKVGASSKSATLQLSSGTGNGAAAAGGLSQASLASSAQYQTQNAVKGSVEGDAVVRSTTDAASGKNGASIVGGSVTAQYGATANSTKTGLFSTNRTAQTTAVTSVVGSATTQFNWGSGTSTIDNQGAANAGASAQSGNVTSSN